MRAFAIVLMCAATVLAEPSATAAARGSIRDCKHADARARAWVFGISVVNTRGTRCASGARILRSVGSRLEVGDYRHLGLSPAKRIAGYDCRASLTGDSAWRITCERDGRSVTGFTTN